MEHNNIKHIIYSIQCISDDDDCFCYVYRTVMYKHTSLWICIQLCLFKFHLNCVCYTVYYCHHNTVDADYRHCNFFLYLLDQRQTKVTRPNLSAVQLTQVSHQHCTIFTSFLGYTSQPRGVHSIPRPQPLSSG